ncbi:cytochrome P450 [Penicillium canariense]|uniref:Cytochrome P450 n=1 Tax=Penicillium canariense TaxID=189055 RepID=A0A9W9LJG2_9EURO|nr:cytochrome P450 [Penicillium canariense]KAJ5157810.1 cytochrome P450 [Penicillium canariense]
MITINYPFLMNLCAAQILLVFGLLLLYVIYQCFFSPLAGFPGPFWAKLTKLYRAYISLRGNAHRDFIALHRKYGNIVRVAPNELSIADPKAFREIYKAGNKFHKAAAYNVVQGTRSFDLVGQRNENIHSEQRRLVARAYSMDSMVYLEPKVNLVISQMVEQLDNISGQTIDLGLWLQLFAFDVIGAISFSKPFGYVKAADDHGLFLRIQNSMSSIAWLMHAGWIFRLHQTLSPIFGDWLAAADRNGHFFKVATQEIEARKARGGDSKDILGQLFTAQEAKPQLTDQDITFMMTSNVFGGSDTTAISLCAVFHMLLKNPDAYNCLMDEFKERRSLGKLSDPVTFEEAESCEYLQAVMYESMRLHPPFGMIMDRDMPAGGMNISKHHIPEGTVVGTIPWVIHTLPEIWGSDAEEFRPERWLDKENQKYLSEYHTTRYILIQDPGY